MIEINELRLRIPSISKEDAQIIGRRVSKLLADSLSGYEGKDFVDHIDLTLSIPGNTSRRKHAIIISNAIMERIKNGLSQNSPMGSVNNHFQFGVENQSQNTPKNPK